MQCVYRTYSSLYKLCFENGLLKNEEKDWHWKLYDGELAYQKSHPMKIKSDFFLGTENTRKKASLSDFETHFKIQYLDPFTTIIWWETNINAYSRLCPDDEHQC